MMGDRSVNFPECQACLMVRLGSSSDQRKSQAKKCRCWQLLSQADRLEWWEWEYVNRAPTACTIKLTSEISPVETSLLFLWHTKPFIVWTKHLHLNVPFIPPMWILFSIGTPSYTSQLQTDCFLPQVLSSFSSDQVLSVLQEPVQMVLPLWNLPFLQTEVVLEILLELRKHVMNGL